MISAKSPRRFIALLLILVLSAGLYIGIAALRPAYHVDEYLTYTLSNGRVFGQVDFLSPYEDVDAFYTGALGLTPEEAFHFEKPIQNARQDAHPPLYYMLVHGLCSLASPQFSIHIAESINLVFFLVSILLCYLILKEILHPKFQPWILFLTLITVLNPGVLNIAVFMRMYLMGMTMCLLLTYGQIKWLKSPSIGYGVSLSIISLIGALTHYYFIFFCFFSWLCCLLTMLKEKYSWKNVLVYLLWPCLAGGLMLAVWPAAIDHVLYRSGRGSESIWSFSRFGTQLSYYFDRLNQNLFGYAFLILGALLLAGYIFKRKMADVPADDDAPFRFSWIAATLLLPTLLYFLLVAKISTYYLDERYMGLIYPLCILSVLLLLWRLASIKKSALLRGLAVACCIVFTASAWIFCSWSYSFRNWNASIHDINSSGASDAIVVLKDDEVWKV